MMGVRGELWELIVLLFAFIKSYYHSTAGNKLYADKQIEASPLNTLNSTLITSVLVKDKMV